jgi:hypothetical protein
MEMAGVGSSACHCSLNLPTKCSTTKLSTKKGGLPRTEAHGDPDVAALKFFCRSESYVWSLSIIADQTLSLEGVPWPAWWQDMIKHIRL